MQIPVNSHLIYSIREQMVLLVLSLVTNFYVWGRP